MPRYIDADKLSQRIKASPAFKNLTRDDFASDLLRNVVFDLIDNAPTADVVEVRRGRWLDDIKEIYPLNGSRKIKALVGYRCSECNRPELRKEPYCNCGAKMDGGE